MHTQAEATGNGGAALWVVAGALVMSGLVGILSVGVFILPVGVGMVVVLALRGTPGAPAMAIGVGGLLVVVGVITLADNKPECTGRGVTVGSGSDFSYACQGGGINGWMWIMGGLVAAAAFPVVTRLINRRESRG